MNCPKCNKSVPANARFCGSCGQQLEAASAAPASLTGAHVSTTASAVAGAASTAASKTWAAASAAAPGLISRIKNIVMTPKSEWPVIAVESTPSAQLFVGYVVPLALLAAVIGFVRMSVLGVSGALGGSFRLPIGSGLTYTVMMFVSALFGVFVIGLIVNGLAPTFSGQRDLRQALKVSAYSLTPALLSSVLALSPILPTLLQFLAGCYGIYVLYQGLPIVMQSPKEKALGYTAGVVICTILIGVVFGILSTFAHIGGARAGLVGATPAERATEQAAARDQGAATVGNAIGNMLGTDAKGKADLGSALSNLTKAGEQAQTPTSAPSSPAAADTANAQSPMAATGGLLNALGGALGGPNRVAPVDFKSLQGMLPTSLAGMPRTSAEGENQGALGVKTSSAKADYAANDGSGVHLEISDISGVSGLIDLANGLIQNTTSQSDAGYEKDVVIGARTVHEKYDAPAKRSELSVIVAKRFSVDLSGKGVDMKSLEQSMGQIDLARLESMKDAGAQPK
jgi:Yip1-like protein/zinc ribbon protein